MSTRSVASEVVCALYAHGCLLLSEASGGDSRTTRLQLASRNNLLLPSPSVNTFSASSGLAGLRELLTELDNYIPGELDNRSLVNWTTNTPGELDSVLTRCTG